MPTKSISKKIAEGVRDPKKVLGYLRAKALPWSLDYIATKDNRSESDKNGTYVRFVKKAVRNHLVFRKFKKHPHYQSVLEHVNQKEGQEYLDVIRQQSPEFVRDMNKFKINDLVGSPDVYDYSGIGITSPTTLRYVKVASDLKRYFGDLDNAKIVEIGVGYGGQCLVYDQICNFKEYHLFDLPPVLELVAQYLECHLLNGAYKLSTLNRSTGDEAYDLVVSNYAFAELPKQVQKKYIEKILSKSKRGYLTMNSGLENSLFKNNHLTLEELRQLLPPFEAIEEIPFSLPGNFIIVWGNLSNQNLPKLEL